MITIAFDEGGYAVSVFKDDELFWNGKAVYLEEVLIGMLDGRTIHVDNLFKREAWVWEDRFESLQELLDNENNH